MSSPLGFWLVLELFRGFLLRDILDACERKQYLPTPAWGAIVLYRWRGRPWWLKCVMVLGGTHSKWQNVVVFPAHASCEKLLFRFECDRMIE